ncbi:LytR/AlgR family response regulator transcription factor [Nonlabens xiamenensis]|uniref:LytR/AlgR family response regulator transcription factor n=1 Tax=Nonlabens xiamenensis TaxID=2341043 RepID=UPI000F608B62|nr:LytTR family DNA-binding domain-containing protein [Nonlabens xiamenensis]
MKAIIIDDENKARSLLHSMLQEHCPDITAYFQADELEQGVAIIKNEQPDLVFLDIEMPRYSGLQILDFFDNQPVDFQIIFTTAYNQYAIDAFKLSAVDYLLKPIGHEELKQAVQKAIDLKDQYSITNNLQELKKSFKTLAANKIALDVPRGLLFINHSDILYMEADGMYTTVYMKGDKKELICKPLKHFADQLEEGALFYKPHRSYLVNINSIKEFNKKEGGHLLMENNAIVPISRVKREEFFEIIKELF